MPTSTRPIADVARELGLAPEEWLPYGRDKAKVVLPALAARREQPDGRLVVVSSITPTPAGDGKTTMTIGLGQALWRIGARPVIALREPSIGPTLGMKGGGRQEQSIAHRRHAAARLPCAALERREAQPDDAQRRAHLTSCRPSSIRARRTIRRRIRSRGKRRTRVRPACSARAWRPGCSRTRSRASSTPWAVRR